MRSSRQISTTFLHTVYKYVLNSFVKISMMFAKYFEHHTIILVGGLFSGHAVLPFDLPLLSLQPEFLLLIFSMLFLAACDLHIAST